MELPIKTQGIIFNRSKNKITYLLLKRTKEDGGFWQPMTGTQNDYESLKDCLLRELKEETGIKKHIQIINNVDKFEWIDKKGKIISEYVYGVEVGKVKVKLSEEHDKFIWLPFAQAKRKLEKENNKRSLTLLNNNLTGTKKEKMNYEEAKALENTLYYTALDKCLDEIDFCVYDWLSEEETELYEKALNFIN